MREILNAIRRVQSIIANPEAQPRQYIEMWGKKIEVNKPEIGAEAELVRLTNELGNMPEFIKLLSAEEMELNAQFHQGIEKALLIEVQYSAEVTSYAEELENEGLNDVEMREVNDMYDEAFEDFQEAKNRTERFKEAYSEFVLKILQKWEDSIQDEYYRTIAEGGDLKEKGFTFTPFVK